MHGLWRVFLEAFRLAKENARQRRRERQAAKDPVTVLEGLDNLLSKKCNRALDSEQGASE